jgi:hypothetical protein
MFFASSLELAPAHRGVLLGFGAGSSYQDRANQKQCKFSCHRNLPISRTQRNRLSLPDLTLAVSLNLDLVDRWNAPDGANRTLTLNATGGDIYNTFTKWLAANA